MHAENDRFWRDPAPGLRTPATNRLHNCAVADVFGGKAVQSRAALNAAESAAGCGIAIAIGSVGGKCRSDGRGSYIGDSFGLAIVLFKRDTQLLLCA